MIEIAALATAARLHDQMGFGHASSDDFHGAWTREGVVLSTTPHGDMGVTQHNKTS